MLTGAALPLTLSLFLGCSNRASTEQVKMRDGVRLETDVFLPKGEGPFSTVLYRTPYGRLPIELKALQLNGDGLAVVAQNVRGRYGSEGRNRVFTTDGDGDLKDGYDTLAWIVGQAWSDGKVAMSGASALGITQYMAASASPPGLVLVSAEVATPNVYSDAMFQGGQRRYSLSHSWLQSQDNLSFEDRLAAHPLEDAFWDSSQTHDQFGSVRAAGLHVGGWYDIFQQGTLDAFRGYQHEGGAGAAGNQKLVMGPWSHGTVGEREQGELAYPSNATAPRVANAEEILFKHYLNADMALKGKPSDIPTVQYYLMGDVEDGDAPGNEWREAEDWPPLAAPVRLHLQSGGGLAEACPAGAESSTAYKVAPLDPVPTICGANLNIKAGPCDQRDLEEREDVLVFDTGVLDVPLEIVGPVSAHLFVSLNRTDTDLMVRMTDVYPDGRSMLITDGALRLASRGTTTDFEPLEPGERVEAVVDLWSTAMVINAGHRLRISIASSNWPRFSVNRNNGEPYPESVEGDPKPLTVTVHHDETAASYLEVPDPRRAPAAFTTCASSAR